MTPDAALRDRLIEVARKIAHERDWPWYEPVEITAAACGGEPVWIIHTHVLMRGQNVRIVLRQSDHSLIEAGFLSR
jgi:hypothetical protein